MDSLTQQHQKFLRRTFELARFSVNSGNQPFGAVLVKSGYLVAEGENTVSDDGCTGHAELNAIRQLHLREQERHQLTLYASTEPCLMCAGAAFWAGIRRVVYSVPALRLARYTGHGFELSCRQLFEAASDKVEVIGPLLEEEGFALHECFWQVSH